MHVSSLHTCHDHATAQRPPSMSKHKSPKTQPGTILDIKVLCYNGLVLFYTGLVLNSSLCSGPYMFKALDLMFKSD